MNARAAIADRRIHAIALAAVALSGCGGGSSPPPDDAAKLVPSTALVYVHLSTDTGRGATKTALKLAQRFPSFERLRSSLLRRLQDRFEQVILITHIDSVREGLDRVVMVRYDEESGSSRVHVESGGEAQLDLQAGAAD